MIRGQSDTLDDWVLFENLRSAITRETKKRVQINGFLLIDEKRRTFGLHWPIP